MAEKPAIKSDSMVFAYHDGNALRLDPKQVITIDIHSNNFPKNDYVSTKYLIEPDLQKEFLEVFWKKNSLILKTLIRKFSECQN